MFIGHYAVGCGAKRFVPRVSLGTLLLAAQFIDLLWTGVSGLTGTVSRFDRAAG